LAGRSCELSYWTFSREKHVADYWEKLLRQLQSYPSGVHKMLPACPEDRLQAVQESLGKMPESLVTMLRHFNGAELFDKCGPMVTVFGVTTTTPLPEFESAPDWWIDQYTPAWRRAGINRELEWVIANTNYGGLTILDKEGRAKEWDQGYRQWGATDA